MVGRIKIITPVSAEPISVDDVKDHLRIDLADEDDYLADLIFAARDYAEKYTRLGLATQTLELMLDRFSEDIIELPYSPVQQVTSFKYTSDTAEDYTLVEGTDYFVDLERIPARIIRAPNVSWPGVVLHPASPIRVRYTAGYNGQTLKIPYHLKAGLLIHVGLLYNYRDQIIPQGALETVRRLYNMHRAVWF